MKVASALLLLVPLFSQVSAQIGKKPSGNQAVDPQTSLTLDPKVIATGFEQNGQQPPVAGQVASLTSSNNFINFCLTVPNLPITNGKQIQTGSCNPAPIGVIPAVGNMPSAKFTSPLNGGNVTADQTFTITMAVKNFAVGSFVNADDNYFAAPQLVNAQGQIIGHSHVVVEALSDLDQATPTDPQKFQFFKGLNSAAVNGELSVVVTGGVPAGPYRLCSINTSSNHQPVIVPVAQHGSLDDCIYFTAIAANADSGDGGAAAGSDGSDSASATAGSAGSDSGSAGAGSVGSGNGGAGSGSGGSTGNAGGAGKAGNSGENQGRPRAGGNNGGKQGQPQAGSDGRGQNGANGGNRSRSLGRFDGRSRL